MRCFLPECSLVEKLMEIEFTANNSDSQPVKCVSNKMVSVTMCQGGCPGMDTPTLIVDGQEINHKVRSKE